MKTATPSLLVEPGAVRPCQWPRDLHLGRSERKLAHAAGTAYDLARAAAAELIKVRYSRASCSFLAGSYATETATEDSDVDIFIIDDRFLNPAREQLVHECYPMQLNAMSLSAALGVIEGARRRGTLSFVPAFAVGRHLSGSRKAFDIIVGAARRAMADGPLSLGAVHVARARVALINNYLKVARYCDDAAERSGACMKLVNSASRYIQLSAGTWVLNEVRYEPTLAASDEYRALIAGLPRALEGEPADFLYAAHAIIASRGEFLWETREVGPLPWSQ